MMYEERVKTSLYNNVIKNIISYFKDMLNTQFSIVNYKPIEDNRGLFISLGSRFNIKGDDLKGLKYYVKRPIPGYDIVTILSDEELPIENLTILDLFDVNTVVIDINHIFTDNDNTNFFDTIFGICKLACADKERNYNDVKRDGIAKDMIAILHPEALFCALAIMIEMDITDNIDFKRIFDGVNETFIPKIIHHIKDSSISVPEMIYYGAHRDIIDELAHDKG